MPRVVPIVPLPAAMPKCWDIAEDWAEWSRLNKVAAVSGQLDHFCADCTPQYAEEMKRQGRCAYPDEATRPEKVKPHAK